jgi:hypothetical protein
MKIKKSYIEERRGWGGVRYMLQEGEEIRRGEKMKQL